MAAAKKSAASSGAGAYDASDFVYVQDAAGVVQADAVPASWVGTNLLPEDWKKATAKAVDGADTNPVTAPSDLPGEGADRATLEAYAVSHGWSDVDAKAFSGTDAEFRAKLAEA